MKLTEEQVRQNSVVIISWEARNQGMNIAFLFWMRAFHDVDRGVYISGRELSVSRITTRSAQCTSNEDNLYGREPA